MPADFPWGQGPLFVQGLLATLMLTVASLVVGSLLGLALAFIRMSGNRAAAALSGGVITFFVATPVIVQLFWIYYALPQMFGIRLGDMETLVLTLGLNAGAMLAENFRAGLLAVNIGQRDATKVLGLTTTQTYRWVILPQAIRVILPLMGSATISILKDTSLATFIGVNDFLNVGRIITTITYRPIEVLSVIALGYFLMTYPISIGTAMLEKRWRHSD